MNRFSTLIFFSLIGLTSCIDSGQKEHESVISISETLLDSLIDRNVKEIILYRIDCKDCKIQLPAYVIWQNDEREFIEKIKTNGQRIRKEVKPFILNYVRSMQDNLTKELISVSDSTNTKFKNSHDGRKETLKVFVDGKTIHFPSCEHCVDDQNKFHHALRDYITTRLFRDEIGGLFESSGVATDHNKMYNSWR